MNNLLRYLIVILLSLGTLQTVKAQDKRKQLEKKRQALREEIEQFNNLISSNKQEKQSVLSKAEDINHNIRLTEELIRANNQEANLLTREISENETKIKTLEKELEELKEDYSEIIRRSYKSKSKQSRLMFLFSSENFLQAYKRLQYMKQYSKYREKQGLKIQEQTKELEELNEKLEEQKKEKEQILAETRERQNKLQGDKQELDKLIAEINQKGSKYRQQIEEKQQEVARIDAEIKEIIRKRLEEENKKKGKRKGSKFEMTPEAKALAADFEANKGKLPWPLKQGNVTASFGKQHHDMAKNLSVNNNGIRIETDENESVLAVFNGEVMDIQGIKGSNPTVIVRHGSYFTIYRNLSSIDVKRGQKVSTGDKLGNVARSSTAGNRPTLFFYILEAEGDFQYMNPMQWIISR